MIRIAITPGGGSALASKQTFIAHPTTSRAAAVAQQMGRSRSAAVAIAFLMRYGGAPLLVANAYFTLRRHVSALHDGFFAQMCDYKPRSMRSAAAAASRSTRASGLGAPPTRSRSSATAVAPPPPSRPPPPPLIDRRRRVRLLRRPWRARPTPGPQAGGAPHA
jgi:hypothetical protein